MNKEKNLTIFLVALLVASVFMMMRTNSASATTTADSHEPDNDHTQAHVIGNGETQQHSIYPIGDQDWLELRIDCDSNVTIETYGPSGQTEMWLYDQALNQLAYDDIAGQGLMSKISTNLNSSIYYIKIDEEGNNAEIPQYYVNATYARAFQSTYGGTGDDKAYSVQQTSDGGYIIAGITGSFGASDWDVYLVKADSSGNMQWNKTYGGTGDDEAYSVRQTSDGGYIIAGYTNSYGSGGYDAYLVKTDSNGNVQWQKTYGSTSTDFGYSAQLTSDGGYIIAGSTWSYGAGNSDVYLVKAYEKGDSPSYRDVILEEGTTLIPAVVYAVLHDPPGDESYSYIQQTNTTSIETTLSGGGGCTAGFEGEVSFLGSGVGASAQVSTKVSGTKSDTLVTSYEVDHKSSWDNQNPWYIGPGYGDAFVGEAWLLHYRIVSRTYPNGTTANVMEYGPTREGSQMLGSSFYVSATWIKNNVQEPWRSKLLAMDLGRDNFIHNDEQGSVSYLDTKTISGNLAYDYSYTVSGRSTGSFAVEVEMSSAVALKCGFDILGIGASGKVKVGFSFNVGITQETATERTTEIGYRILDHDSVDTLNVDIYYDKVYGTYLFITRPELTNTTNPQEFTPHIHKIGVTSVSSSKTVVCQGYSANISVTAANQGINPETFNVTAYANTTSIASQNVSLSSQSSTEISFAWNTSGFAKGNYVLSAYAQPVPGETDTTDNNFTDSWIKVTIVGDVNGDGKVNLIDVFAVSLAFGSYPGHPAWNPNCDINNDGAINLIDYFIVALNYGKTDP